MLMTDIIAKKRDGKVLSDSEINFMIDNYTKGIIPDYQMSSMCMAILLKGMTREETLAMTKAMMDSGDKINLDTIEGITADKHSTGGVGDKTSLVLCPLVASCGIKIAKMSGRGLGHTGGTLDKLESFNGYSTSITEEEFLNNVRGIGISITGQTAEIDPADKKLYALRDVTGTVPSIPLIVSSIMSKKLAAGADIIVLDVKTGSGAFMKTQENAEELAQELVSIGKMAGKKTVAVISDMDEPLGFCVGNALEVKEAIKVLKGESCGHVLELVLELGSCILTEAGLAEDHESAKQLLQSHIDNGSALNKLADLVEAQGGNREQVYNEELLPKSTFSIPVYSSQKGYVKHIDTEGIGLISMHLGGGRQTKDDIIDLSVGLVLNKKVGDYIEENELIGTIYANSEVKGRAAAGELLKSYEIVAEKVEAGTFIKKIIK